MSKWVCTTLGEIVSSGGGKIQTGPFGSQLHAADYVEIGIPCIMPANMKNNRLDLTDIALISENDANRLSQHLVQAGDIVYSRRGDVTQKALIRKTESGYFCGTGCLLIRPGVNIDPEFLTYHLSTPSNKSWIINQAVGATMPNLNTFILSKVPLRVPDKTTQQKIAAILSTLDAKIDINNRINAELEAMAKTLYDYWFVQFDFPDKNGKPYKSSGGKMIWNKELKREVPAEWEVADLGIFEKNIVTGKTPPKETPEYFGGDIPFITIGDIRGNMHVVDTAETLSKKGADYQKNKYLSKGAICVTCIASPGLVGFASELSQTNQQINSIECEKEENRYYLYFAIKDYFVTSKAKTGNTFANMNKGDFASIRIIKPAEDITNKYMNAVKASFELVLNNSLENKKLSSLRNWLLPMLMNGQVKVS